MDSESFKIIRGDACDSVKRLPDGKFRAVITSPPYYGHRHYGDNHHEIGREQTYENYLDSLTNVFEACRDILTEDGSLCMVIGDTKRRHEKLRIPHRLAERLVQAGYVFREDIIWYKKNNISSSSHDNFSQAYEYVLFFSKNRRSYANLDAVRVPGNEHFAIFPEELVDNVIRFATEKGDFVLDPFAGRGTTGIVATSLGRKFVGIDLYKENVKASRNIAKADGVANLIMGLASYRRH